MSNAFDSSNYVMREIDAQVKKINIGKDLSNQR